MLRAAVEPYRASGLGRSRAATARRRACNRAGTIDRRRVELTPILGHLILGSDPKEGGPDPSSSKYPPEFQREAVELVFRPEPRSYGALGMG
jgi:hypothetical protein